MCVVMTGPERDDFRNDPEISGAFQGVELMNPLTASKRKPVSNLQLPVLRSTALVPCYECMYVHFVSGSAGGGNSEHKAKRCRQELKHAGVPYDQDLRYGSNQPAYRTRGIFDVVPHSFGHLGGTDTDDLMHDSYLHYEATTPQGGGHLPQHITSDSTSTGTGSAIESATSQTTKRGRGRPRKGTSTVRDGGHCGGHSAVTTNVRRKNLLKARAGRPWHRMPQAQVHRANRILEDLDSDMDHDHPEASDFEIHMRAELVKSFGEGAILPAIHRLENSCGRRTVFLILPSSKLVRERVSAQMQYTADLYHPLYIMLSMASESSEVRVMCSKCDFLAEGLPRHIPDDGAVDHLCETRAGMCECGSVLLQYVREVATDQQITDDADTFKHIWVSAPAWVPEYDITSATPDDVSHGRMSLQKVPASCREGESPFPYTVVGKFGTPFCGVVTKGPKNGWKCTTCSKMFGCKHRSIMQVRVDMLAPRCANQQLFFKRSSAQNFDTVLGRSVDKNGGLLNLCLSRQPIPDVPSAKVDKQLTRVPEEFRTLMKRNVFRPYQVSAMAYLATVGPIPATLTNRFALVESTLAKDTLTVLLQDPLIEAPVEGEDDMDNREATPVEHRPLLPCCRYNGVLFTTGGVMPVTVQSMKDPLTQVEIPYDGSSDACINVDNR